MPKNDNSQAVRFLNSMEKHGEREAGERFCEAHPLGKSADYKKRFAWAKQLCAFLNDHYDDETVRAVRADCACGPARSFVAKIRPLYEQDRDPAAFVDRTNRLDLGFSLEYDGTSYCVVYPQCYCSCVNRVPEALPEAWCYCTLGFSERMFREILGTEVRAELICSVKTGADCCRIRITAV